MGFARKLLERERCSNLRMGGVSQNGFQWVNRYAEWIRYKLYADYGPITNIYAPRSVNEAIKGVAASRWH
jgi:hypothetical protein